MDDTDNSPRPPPAHWLAVLDESDADLAAGRIVPMAEVRAELRASIARVEARLAERPEHAPASDGP